jgi:hypothetical protein
MQTRTLTKTKDDRRPANRSSAGDYRTAAPPGEGRNPQPYTNHSAYLAGSLYRAGAISISELWRRTPVTSNASHHREALEALSAYGIAGWSNTLRCK